jgi:hypothetical protein
MHKQKVDFLNSHSSPILNATGDSILAMSKTKTYRFKTFQLFTTNATIVSSLYIL